MGRNILWSFSYVTGAAAALSTAPPRPPRGGEASIRSKCMSFLLNWLKDLTASTHSSEWISGITGAAGAILGSLVTVSWTAWYGHRTRRLERREKFAAGAFAAYQRLNQIYSIALVVRNHLDQGQALAAEKGQPACTTTMGMQRMSGPVFFPIEELWTLTQVGGNKLINRVNSLDHAFNSLLDSVDRYGLERQELWVNFPTPDKMDGIVGDVGLTEDQRRALAPGIAALDHILEQLRPMARSIVNDTFEALTLLMHAKSHPLGKNFKIALPSPTGEQVEISAQDGQKGPLAAKSDEH